MKQASRKVPGGKLIRLKAGIKEGKLSAPQLSGDFFLSPPEAIKQLEEAMEGWPVEEAKELEEVLGYVIEREHISIQGFTAKDVALLVEELA